MYIYNVRYIPPAHPWTRFWGRESHLIPVQDGQKPLLSLGSDLSWKISWVPEATGKPARCYQ